MVLQKVKKNPKGIIDKLHLVLLSKILEINTAYGVLSVEEDEILLSNPDDIAKVQIT